MPNPPSAPHDAAAAAALDRQPVRCAVLTISDTRTLETDEGGRTLIRLLQAAGHQVSQRAIIRDEPLALRAALEAWTSDPSLDAIISTGGTGIARRDSTIDVVRSILTHELDGFGELFRMLSYEQVGAAAMLSRAVGGLVMRDPAHGGDTFLFAVPGSVNAVETAVAKLIAPQLAHLVWERRK